ncbi:MAG: PAS domain-containing protein, partial [bacterium]
TNGGSQTINLTVSYVKKPEYLEGLLMAVFRDATPPKMEKTTKLKSVAKERASQRTAELEYELRSAKEHLQTVIEELETSNEELKSMNEELQSSNEELQSTNEELETSKEELQSVNEELVTVNSELQNKIDELSQVNNDMINLLASTQIATIFLGNDLRIKRFTPPMTAVFKLIQTDVGRPISDIVSRMDYADLVQDTEEVIKTLSTKEKVVRGENGAWFLIRIMPYRTMADVIDGVVVTFIDITEQKKAQETLQDALNYSDGIIETVREPLVILDAGLRIRSANKSFYTTFEVTPEETENQLIYDLGNRQWDIPALRELLEKILSENVRFEDFVVEHTFPTVGRMKMALNARRFFQQGKQTEMILLAMEDVTDRR